MKSTPTVQSILDAGIRYLDERGCPDARHSMQSLLVHALVKDKTWLYLHYQDPIDDAAQLATLRELLKRRGQGEPLQHLLGSVEFYRREFRSDARALIPRPETEELVELALSRVTPSAGMRILDMGTGSGIIGITLALELAEQQPEVTLVDVSESALSLALENATRLHARVKTYRSDLFSLWQQEDSESSHVKPPSDYNLVLANLPYIPDAESSELAREVHHDPSLALYGGADGLDIIRRFLTELPRYAAASGALVLLEVGHDQGEATRALMEQLGYTDTSVACDLNGIARFPLGTTPTRAIEPEEETMSADESELNEELEAHEEEEDAPEAPAPAAVPRATPSVATSTPLAPASPTTLPNGDPISLRMEGYDDPESYPF